MNVEISKCIYQCAPDKFRLRDEYVDNIKLIRELNPDYRYEMFDDSDIEEFICAEFGGRFIDALSRFNEGYGAAKADFFRYLLVYKRGGVYLDIKSTAERPLDSVLAPEDQFILSHWKNDDPSSPYYRWGIYPELRHSLRGEYQQWHVIACPEHPYLRAVIQLMMERIEGYSVWRSGFGHVGVVRTTGPVMYTQAIYPIKDLYPHRLISNESEIGLQYSVLPRKHDHREGVSHYSNSYLPVLRTEGSNAACARVYLAACRGFNDFIRSPMRRLLGGR